VTIVLTRPLSPPHDPWQRTPVAWVGAWEVRQFDRADPRVDGLRRRGFLHLQLWHPGRRISILSPSRLTEGCFEAALPDGERIAEPTWAGLRERFGDLELPSTSEIFALESWFVRPSEPRVVQLLRRWWSGAARPSPVRPARDRRLEWVAP
jgi:hypothetical protein